MISKEKLTYEAQKAYVTTMMDVIGGGLAAASRVDESIRKELAYFPAGYQICMTVFPSGPSFYLRMQEGGIGDQLAAPIGKPDLTIRIKHMAHAMLLLSFQEGTVQAFANDRMVADGNIGHSIRLVRCLNTMQSLILPKAVATLALKRYENIPFSEKIRKAANIYGLLAKSALTGKKS